MQNRAGINRRIRLVGQAQVGLGSGWIIAGLGLIGMLVVSRFRVIYRRRTNADLVIQLRPVGRIRFDGNLDGGVGSLVG